MANLLSHTAGLSVHGFGGYDRTGKIPSLTDILDGKKPANSPAVRSMFEPGLRFQYSGGGTTISQLIVTDLTRQPYDKFMLENVLQPLEMTNSSYSQPPSPEKMKDLATGHTVYGDESENKFNVYPEQAAAGLWTTATDLCKYIIETQKAFEGKSSKVLNQEMTRLRLQPYIDTAAALGVFIENRNGVKYFSHNAGNYGFMGYYIGSMEGGDGMAILVNSENANLFQEIVNSVASVYKWKGFVAPPLVKSIKISDSLKKKYAGAYVFDGSISEITIQPDGLKFWTLGKEVKAIFTSEKDFFHTEYTANKSFIVDSTGKVLGYNRIVTGMDLPPAYRIENFDTLRAIPYELNLYGWHLVETRRYKESIAVLQRALEIEKEFYAIRVNLAHAYLFGNEFDKAISMYRESMNFTPDILVMSKNMIMQDWKYLERKGFNKTRIANAKKALKL